MKRALLQLLFSFLLISYGIWGSFSIEFINKTTQVIFEHVAILSGLAILFINYRFILLFRPPIVWIFHIVNACLIIVLGFTLLFDISRDISGKYCVWTDKNLYVKQNDTIINQVYYVSGSIMDGRLIKVKENLHWIRFSTIIKPKYVSGYWELIDLNNRKDTIINFK